MTKSASTILAVTGDLTDVASAQVSTYSLTEATFSELTRGQFPTLPEPSKDDIGRWVFPGSQPDVLPLAKALSRLHPEVQWSAVIPNTSTNDTYHYFLKGGTGTAIRTTNDTANSPVPVPTHGLLTFHYAVGDQSNVLEAVIVVHDGTTTDITDGYLCRAKRDDFAHLPTGTLSAEFTYDEDDITALLNNAH